jgi:hypothetical protein
VVPGGRLAARVCPARHVGSVDSFLEAMEGAAPGDLLVVDNGGRLDEACVGDLMVLEAQGAGLEGRSPPPLEIGRWIVRTWCWATYREHLRAVRGAIEE